MEFLVKLIEVHDTKDQDARDDLNANCTHVANGYWLFEGDEEALAEGIDFTIIGEEVIENYGDLSSNQLIKMVSWFFNKHRECPNCKGAGKVPHPDGKLRDCFICGGDKQI